MPEFTGVSINVGDNPALGWSNPATVYPEAVEFNPESTDKELFANEAAEQLYDINIIEQIDKETANIIDFI